MRLGIGNVGFEDDLVRDAVHVEQLAFDLRVDGPHRHAGAQADGAIGPVLVVEVERLAPVGQLAEHVGDELDHAGANGRSISCRVASRSP